MTPQQAEAEPFRTATGGTIAFLIVAAAALVLAWLNRFVQDDAFISFLYAKQLVAGNGLTWFGTRVEGYTNFLWVVWIALGLRLGAEPVLWSYVGGLASFAAALWGVWRLAQHVFDAIAPVVLSVLLFATNYSVLAFATGGLETMLQTALLCLAVGLVYELHAAATRGTRGPGGTARDGLALHRLVLLSLLLAASVLTRPDSALPGLLIGLGAVWAIGRRRSGPGAYLALVVPVVVLVGAWLIWKAVYYGDLLPNTFHAKVSRDWTTVEAGLVYLGRFLHWYLLWPFLLAGTVALLVGRRSRANRRALFLLAFLVPWLGYLVLVGGDFMEFRLLVPVAPFLFVFLAYVIHEAVGKWLRAPLACAALSLGVLAAASYRHAVRFDGITPDQTLDSVPALATFYGRYPDGRWDRIGSALGESLAGTGAVLALDAVGAIPYYSGLETVDMWGLNDRQVAERGTPVPPSYRRPGHRRHATLEYLRRRGVHFVIGHPTKIPRGTMGNSAYLASYAEWTLGAVAFNREPIPEATLVAVPLDDEQALLVWYLTRRAEIDRVIVERGWEYRRLELGSPTDARDPDRSGDNVE